jgi:hypothetical protein
MSKVKRSDAVNAFIEWLLRHEVEETGRWSKLDFEEQLTLRDKAVMYLSGT